MIRKSMLALAAIATLGTAALAPTSASAWGFKHHHWGHGFGGGWGFYGARYVDVPAGPACAGPTEDGICELRLTEVPLETGGAELQCVAYCPQ